MTQQILSDLSDQIYDVLVSKLVEGSSLPNYSKSILKRAINLSSEETYRSITRGDIVETRDSMFSAIFTATKIQLKYFKEVERHPCIVTNTIDLTLDHTEEALLVGMAMPTTPTMEQFNKVITETGFLHIIKEECIAECIVNYRTLLSKITDEGANIICYPELSGLNDDDFKNYLLNYCYENGIILISGSYHAEETSHNVCRIYLPDRRFFDQNKIFPSERYDEGISSNAFFDRIFLFRTQKFTFVVLICIDSERNAIMDVMHDLIDSGLGVDLVFNPSFTPAIKRVDTDSVRRSLEYRFIPIFCNKITESAIYCPFYDLKENDFKLFVMRDKTFEVFALSMDIIKQVRDIRAREHRRMVSGYG